MKILIVKLGALGDLVMATAFIKSIQKAHPGDEIWLLTAPPYDLLFKGWSGVRTIAFPRKSISATLKSLCWIRKQKFSCIYDLQSNDRTSLLLALSGSPKRVGNHPRFPYTHHPDKVWDEKSHILERMNEVLASAGIEPAEPSVFLPIDSDGEEKVRNWRDRHIGKQTFAIFHAGASARWPAKRWPYFQQLAEVLTALNYLIVWIGANEDEEINRELSRQVGINATGEFSVTELAELARHARFAVTNDSGPMHIMSGSGIPVYAFFGPTEWHRSHALTQREHVIYNREPCAACMQPDSSARADHTCLPGIPVRVVLDKLKNDGVC